MSREATGRSTSLDASTVGDVVAELYCAACDELVPMIEQDHGATDLPTLGYAVDFEPDKLGRTSRNLFRNNMRTCSYGGVRMYA